MHPTKDFEYRFDEGKTGVEQMMELGREAVKLCAARKREKEMARKAKTPWKKKLHPCVQLANEYAICATQVWSARKAAQAFTDEETDAILDVLKAANHVPGIELFRIWATVPREHRDRWIRITIAEGWDTEELKWRTTEEFSKRSNGGRKPYLPTEPAEATRIIGKTRARLLAVHEAVVSKAPLEGGPTPKERTAHWRKLDSHLQQMLADVESVDWSPIAVDEEQDS